MKTGKPIRIHLWLFGLSLLTLLTTCLAVIINPPAVTLISLTLLITIITVGLMTNMWGGLIASAISAFVMALLYQYVDLYPYKNLFFNIATQFIGFLLMGPLAGRVARVIKQMQQQTRYWLEQAEAHSAHDEMLGTLKPDWAKARLDEEILRASQFKRPLSILLLQLNPLHHTIIRAERIAALQALIRSARAAVPSPAVVSHLGRNQILVILPEHTAQQVNPLITQVKHHFDQDMYAPIRQPRWGRPPADNTPSSQVHRLQVGTITLNGHPETSETLLTQAQAALK